MGTYKIPRDVSGESRILMIFSWKALGFSAIGAAIGAVFVYLFSLINLIQVGIVILAIFVLAGFSIGTFKVPEIDTFEITRKTGGLNIDEVIKRGIQFKLRGKKIYVYAREDKNND